MERSISKEFMNDLKNGLLNPIVARIKNDKMLMLCLRGGYISIYYRGGNILCLTEKRGYYEAFYDTNYLKSYTLPDVKISAPSHVEAWLKEFPILKEHMDIWFSTNEKLEREFQQVVARENNYSKIAESTDYFVTDIEVAIDGARFDMLAVKWPSGDRKKHILQLAFIEMKYGINAFDGSAGITKHLSDFDKAMSNTNFIKDAKEMALEQMHRLADLGLIPFTGGRTFEMSNEKPEVIFLFANHNPRSTKLVSILKDIGELVANKPYDLKFFVASSAGYGLYKECMFNYERYNSLLQIYN